MSTTRPIRTALQRSLVGPAGEHYCLAQLVLRGYLATPAPPGTPDVDILVLSPDRATVAATVQVKTRTYGRDQGWHFNDKHERLVADRMFYALVDFEPAAPAVYIVPFGASRHHPRRGVPGVGTTPGGPGPAAQSGQPEAPTAA